ncbi:MAG: PTPA-CTERM sorting domain-containing protein [Bacteroidota bacterium]
MTKSFLSLGVIASAAALAVGTTAPAQALTFNDGSLSATPVASIPLGAGGEGPVTTASSPGAIIDFNGLSLGAFTPFSIKGIDFSSVGDVEIRVGGANSFAPPSVPTAGGIFTVPSSVENNISKFVSIGKDGSLIADFLKPAKSFGFAWGYGDNTDTVTVSYESGSSSIFTNKAIFGNPEENSAYVNVAALAADDLIKQVVWSKTGNGRFEIDNVSVVPTPALLPGLVGMGIAAFRKRKKAGEVQEA